MVRAFLLAACALLCLQLGESIYCIYCLVYVPRIGCMTKLQKCYAPVGEECMTIQNIYEGDVKYQIHGCTRNGKKGCDGCELSGDHILKFNCCGKDYCNV